MNLRPRRPAAVGRMLLCAGSVLLAWGGFEVPALLGLVDYPSVFQARRAPWERPGNRTDGALLHLREGNRRLRPKLTGNDVARLRTKTSPHVYHCDVRYDRDGFRNERDLDSADVVVLGDSLIEGVLVDRTEIATARLAQSTGLVVANLARGGDGPEQELEVLKRYGLRLRPSVCVWAFYEGNDLADSAEYPANQSRVDAWNRRSWWMRRWGGSFTLNCLSFLDRGFVHPEPLAPAGRFTGRFVDASGAVVDLAFGSGDYRVEAPREGSAAFERAKTAIAEARRICRGRGIAFLFVFIPSKLRVYRDICTFDSKSPCRDWLLDGLPEAIRGAVVDPGAKVDFLDLTPRMRKEAALGRLVYLPDDTHWSSDGHRAAAEELAVCISAANSR